MSDANQTTAYTANLTLYSINITDGQNCIGHIRPLAMN